jgi:uncharacterized membrane protein
MKKERAKSFINPRIGINLRSSAVIYIFVIFAFFVVYTLFEKTKPIYWRSGFRVQSSAVRSGERVC